MRDLEHQIAVVFVAWWAYNHNRFGINEKLLFAVPNGSHRNIGVAKKLKAEGVRRGVSDYFLCVPRNGKHGLFLELKAEKGRLSKEQGEFIDLANSQGYAWAIPYGTDQAIKAVEDYIK